MPSQRTITCAGHLPTLEDIFDRPKYSGLPGFSYCLIPGSALGRYVQGTADLTKITFNGKLQRLAPGRADFSRPCKKGGWKTFTNPTFKNQGQCVKHLVHGRNAAKKNA